MGLFLETERLYIKNPEFGDFDNLYLLQSDPAVMQYVGQGIRSKIEVMDGLVKAILHQEKHGFSLGSVYEKQNDQFVGRAGLIYLAYDDSQTEIEIGYALIKSAWNKGYATELAEALIRWGFQYLPINKLVAVINPENKRSRKVLEKCHMHYVKNIMYNGKQAAFYQIDK